MSPAEALRRAIEQYGSQRRLADACGFDRTTIRRALAGEPISPGFALAIERATDGKVPRETLYPAWPARAS